MDLLLKVKQYKIFLTFFLYPEVSVQCSTAIIAELPTNENYITCVLYKPAKLLCTLSTKGFMIMIRSLPDEDVIFVDDVDVSPGPVRVRLNKYYI